MEATNSLEHDVHQLRDDFEERRKVIHDIRNQMQSMELRMEKFEEGLAANTIITQKIESSTGELLEMFTAAKGGFKVIGGLGSFVKWVLGIAAAGFGLYRAMGGKWPLN